MYGYQSNGCAEVRCQDSGKDIHLPLFTQLATHADPAVDSAAATAVQGA